MSILDSIKGQRKLSFDCWRYRLLHWCFNVENPDVQFFQRTGLPKFLYSCKYYRKVFALYLLQELYIPINKPRHPPTSKNQLYDLAYYSTPILEPSQGQLHDYTQHSNRYL